MLLEPVPTRIISDENFIKLKALESGKTKCEQICAANVLFLCLGYPKFNKFSIIYCDF